MHTRERLIRESLDHALLALVAGGTSAMTQEIAKSELLWRMAKCIPIGDGDYIGDDRVHHRWFQQIAELGAAADLEEQLV